LHEPEVQPSSHSCAPLRFPTEQLGSRDVDDIDSAGCDEQASLLRILAIDGVKGILDVLDGAEEDRAIDAQHLQLRAVGQSCVGVEMIMASAKVRLHIPNAWTCRLVQEQQQ